ncbi:hypothetical protein [Nocardia sp. R6R-6]|uniref:hypothetical protein n=1 Tax=Nocardia sp. R6R-6 TaxID=3459303 RepID=UPI00403DF222
MDAELLQHPAVEIATRRVSDFDPGLTPVAAAVRAGMVAVVLESGDKRFTVHVEYRDGEWVAPNFVCGTPRRDRQREAVTGHQPLCEQSRKWFHWPAGEQESDPVGWHSVTGIAALDAVAVSLTSTLESSTSPIGESGLAFTLVQGRWADKPVIGVHTRDGRTVTGRP